MERSLPLLSATDSIITTSAVAPAPDKNAIVLTVVVGVLVFWTAAGLTLDYMIGDHRFALFAAKAALAIAVCIAVPVLAVLSIIPAIAAPLTRLGATTARLGA